VTAENISQVLVWPHFISKGFASRKSINFDFLLKESIISHLAKDTGDPPPPFSPLEKGGAKSRRALQFWHAGLAPLAPNKFEEAGKVSTTEPVTVRPNSVNSHASRETSNNERGDGSLGVVLESRPPRASLRRPASVGKPGWGRLLRGVSEALSKLLSFGKPGGESPGWDLEILTQRFTSCGNMV
jgi:hypothetical protein